MTRTIPKAFAYVIRRGRLLVFRQPEALQLGLQVPAGTIDENETPEQAVLREAREETGLDGLRIVKKLGEYARDMRDVGEDTVHHRHYFELALDRHDAPETWRWYERDSCNGGPPIAFDFLWVPLDAVPALYAEHDYFIKR